MTFDAKWRPQSRDFHATPVKNPAEDVDPRLHAEVVRITRQCIELLGCRDYARVDYRIDEAGRPYVLEVNPNPCISPLAGVAAALESAKIPYAEFLTGLVRAALRRGPRPELADWTNATATPVASGPVTNWTVTEVAAIDADALRSLVRLDAMFLPDDRTRNEAWLLSQWERSTLQFAVTDGGRVRGAASVTLIDSNLGVYQWTGLAVHPEDRRRGIGQTLMTHVHRAIRALGGRMLLGHVATHPGFAAVRQLLSARGYRPSGEIAEYFPDGYSRQTFAMAFPQIHQTNSNPIHDQSVTSFPTRYSVSGSNLM
jgi:ribosomal protein S18 acetylase RimI-like enzyme